jgi:hypothetical protein
VRRSRLVPTPNQTPDTALRNTTIPLGWALTVNDLSPPYETWYVYRATVYDKYVSVRAYPTGVSTFNPQIEVFRHWPSTVPEVEGDMEPWPPSLSGLVALGTEPASVPVVPGYDFYFKLRNQGGGSLADASFEILWNKPPSAPAPGGSLIITDDTDDFPAAVTSTDGTILAYVTAPAGEYGFSMPSGRIIHQVLDTVNNTEFLGFYDRRFVPSILWELPAGHTFAALTYDASENVYLFTDPFGAGNASLFIFNSQGTLLDSVGDLGFALSSNAGAGVTPDGSLIYFGTNPSTAIKRWDVAGETLLSDFPPGPPSGDHAFRGRDLWVLPDTSVLIPWRKITPTTNFKLRRYNAAGTLLTTYDFGVADGFARWTVSPLDSNLVYFMDQEVTGTGQNNIFKILDLTTGVITQPGSAPVFSSGQGFIAEGEEATVPVFGTSPCCPIIVASESVTEPEPLSDGIPCPCPSECACPDEGQLSATPLGPIPPEDETVPVIPWIAQCDFGAVFPDGNTTTAPESWL